MLTVHYVCEVADEAFFNANVRALYRGSPLQRRRTSLTLERAHSPSAMDGTIAENAISRLHISDGLGPERVTAADVPNVSPHV